MSLQNQLSSVRFFDGFADTLLRHLARTGTPAQFARGDTLFTAGDARTFFAVILSGSVAIELAHDGAVTPLATLGSGEVVGEGILLDDTHHGTTARALEPVDAVLFHLKVLAPVLENTPQLHAALDSSAACSCGVFSRTGASTFRWNSTAST